MVNERALEADRLMMRKMKALAELEEAQNIIETEEGQFYDKYHQVRAQKGTNSATVAKRHRCERDTVSDGPLQARPWSSSATITVQRRCQQR
jgi:hypothetical protein